MRYFVQLLLLLCAVHITELDTVEMSEARAALAVTLESIARRPMQQRLYSAADKCPSQQCSSKFVHMLIAGTCYAACTSVDVFVSLVVLQAVIPVLLCTSALAHTSAHCAAQCAVILYTTQQFSEAINDAEIGEICCRHHTSLTACTVGQSVQQQLYTPCETTCTSIAKTLFAA